MIDKIVSHYKIISQVGQGGMGVLYLAEDLELNRKAVLKFLPPDMMNDPESNLRFKREAQSAGSLSHPNIVTIYDVGVHENKTFIAMEYVEGKTLREVITSDELTIEKITDISVQICEGLNEAHSKGITHRDIKPENILIDEKGKVKIVDFGLAKIKNVSRGITKQDSTVGTLKYMSPEQIRNQNVDHRSDIWSFGVILYEMITGKYPFKGEHDASLFYSIINQAPEPLARYKADINEGFQRIIDKSLDKDPETRYQHIDELLSDLRREKRDSGEFTASNLKKKNTRLIKRISFISAALLGIVLIFFAINYFLNNPAKKLVPPKHTQLTFEGHISFFPYAPWSDISQISPNGQFTAYIAGGSIYLKDNSGEQAIEIFKGLNQVSSLRWSPDGNEIFFSALKDNSWSSFIIPKLGGKSQSLKYIRSGCWSPDGSLIAGVKFTEKKIVLLKRETDEIVRTIEPAGDFTWIYDIDWSPNSDQIIFFTTDDNAGKNAIWIINTDGTKQRKILEEKKSIYCPRWSRDGNYIYYLQSNELIYQSSELTHDLMKIEVSSPTSNKEAIVVQPGLLAWGFSITRDNKILCYTKYSAFHNLWRFNYNEDKNPSVSKKLTDGTTFFNMPDISPDGREIAFVHKSNIFKMSIDGDSMQQLTFLNSPCRSPSWSPTGKQIAFISDSKLYSISSKGGTPSVLTDNNVGFGAYWLLDPEIFYQKAGNRNYYIINPITQESKLLVPNDSVGWMMKPCLSSDNLNIAVLWNRAKQGNEKEKGLWIISRKDSSQELLLKGEIYPLKWSGDSKWIFATSYDKYPNEIFLVSVQTGRNKMVYILPSSGIDLGYDLSISPDAKTIVCTVQETSSDVWMIENFDPDVE